MIAADDPRAAELLRRRALKNGASPAPAATTPEPAEPRKLDDAGKALINRLAAEHPKWSASDLADAFEAEHGWRPSYQGIGRALSEPAPRKGKPGGRKPGRKAGPPANPNAEVEAIAAVFVALTPLSPAQVRRVLDWARAAFQEGGDE